jgi:hypothetical protein
MTTMTASSNSSSLDSLRAKLTQLQELETNLSASSLEWRDDSSSSSPTTVVNSDLIARYQEARSLYLQRRMQHLMLDHIRTFDGSSFEFPQDDDDNDDDDNDNDKKETKDHTETLQKLETAATKCQSQRTHLQDLYQSVVSKREDLEYMIQDLEDKRTDQDDAMEEDDDHSSPVEEQELQLEQERMDQLQQRKRQLQQELASLSHEAQVAKLKSQSTKVELEQLQSNTNTNDDDSDHSQALKEKITELIEMKEWYDSLRHLMEELGGVQIKSVTEGSNRNLMIHLQLYDLYPMQVSLQTYRQTSLQLVDARWMGGPLHVTNNYNNNSDDDKKTSSFSLPLESLEDLVQVSKSTLGPVDDLRFVVREAMGRIRTLQQRVLDLDAARQHVLTKVVGDQVVCSWNDGIVVVLRYFDHLVKVEQVVGVGGWETGKIQELQQVLQSLTSLNEIVETVQTQIQEWKQQGVHPGTPTLPKKKQVDN